LLLVDPAQLGRRGWIEELLVGAWHEHWLAYNVPPLPWLGLYLVASALGSLFARLHDQGRRAQLRQVFLALGGAALAAGLLLRVGLGWLAERVASPVLKEQLIALGIVIQRLPPSPTYMLFYSGVALLMLTLLLTVESTAWGAALIRWLSVFGRNSLVCF